MARREAPPAIRKDCGAIGLRLSARHPPQLAPSGGETLRLARTVQQTPALRPAFAGIRQIRFDLIPAAAFPAKVV
jgi:hypothetical protein